MGLITWLLIILAILIVLALLIKIMTKKNKYSSPYSSNSQGILSRIGKIGAECCNKVLGKKYGI
jgi:hypothetical protein